VADLTFDQRQFDQTLARYLARLKEEVRPRAINKKLFFVARGAIPRTPKVTPEQIEADMAREIQVKRVDGTEGNAQLGYVLAAKQAAKTFGGSKAFQKAVTRQEFGKSGGSELAAWRAHVKATYKKMIGARKRGVGFIRVGWLSVIAEMREKIGGSYSLGPGPSSAGTRLVGRLKSRLQIARPGDDSGAIGVNLAKAQWDKREGQYEKGEPALEQSMADEERSMNEFLEKEMEKETEEFNRAQH